MKTPQIPALPGMTPMGFKPKKARKTKQEKLAEARIERIVGQALVGNPINVFDIAKVYAVARENAALPETELAAKVGLFVQSLVQWPTENAGRAFADAWRK